MWTLGFIQELPSTGWRMLPAQPSLASQGVPRNQEDSTPKATPVMNALVLWFPKEGQSSPALPLCSYTHGTCILCWIQEAVAWTQTDFHLPN